jgi:uncharacterized membrane protein YdfJ with MMPL/SSD domain
MLILPRQARDKHRESAPKKTTVFAQIMVGLSLDYDVFLVSRIVECLLRGTQHNITYTSSSESSNLPLLYLDLLMTSLFVFLLLLPRGRYRAEGKSDVDSVLLG